MSLPNLLSLKNTDEEFGRMSIGTQNKRAKRPIGEVGKGAEGAEASEPSENVVELLRLYMLQGKFCEGVLKLCDDSNGMPDVCGSDNIWFELCSYLDWNREDRTTGVHKLGSGGWREHFFKWCGLRFKSNENSERIGNERTYEPPQSEQLKIAVQKLANATNGTCQWPTDQRKVQALPADVLLYGPISTWDVRGVKSMKELFLDAKMFNANISNWDVSGVEDMYGMFSGATYFNNGDSPLCWNVKSVQNMENMFSLASSFNQMLLAPDSPDVVTGQQIETWNVSNVKNMQAMFAAAYKFNQDIGSWDVSNVENMRGMFLNASSFNQNIGSWNVSQVVTMSKMFFSAASFNNGDKFGQASNNRSLVWNTSNVREMQFMFANAIAFNQALLGDGGRQYGEESQNAEIPSGWDVSKVLNMNNMFENAFSFNQYIGDWRCAQVRTLSHMFQGALKFNNGSVSEDNIPPLEWYHTLYDASDTTLMFNNAGIYGRKTNRSIEQIEEEISKFRRLMSRVSGADQQKVSAKIDTLIKARDAAKAHLQNPGGGLQLLFV